MRLGDWAHQAKDSSKHVFFEFPLGMTMLNSNAFNVQIWCVFEKPRLDTRPDPGANFSAVLDFRKRPPTSCPKTKHIHISKWSIWAWKPCGLGMPWIYTSYGFGWIRTSIQVDGSWGAAVRRHGKFSRAGPWCSSSAFPLANAPPRTASTLTGNYQQEKGTIQTHLGSKYAAFKLRSGVTALFVRYFADLLAAVLCMPVCQPHCTGLGQRCHQLKLCLWQFPRRPQATPVLQSQRDGVISCMDLGNAWGNSTCRRIVLSILSPDLKY